MLVNGLVLIGLRKGRARPLHQIVRLDKLRHDIAILTMYLDR